MTTRLKRDEAFSAVYRRGTWVHGPLLSIGALPNREAKTRIGLRTKRGTKGAVVRNRLKRQLRAILDEHRMLLRSGVDIVIVAHPKTIPARTNHLRAELRTLCKRTGILSLPAS